jgi:MFS family permease
MRGNPQFIRFLANTLVGNLGAFLASPLYIIYYVRQLGASDAWIASSTLVANVAAMLGFVLARRFIPRFGEGKLLRITWPLTGLLPLLIGTSGSLNVVLVIIFCYQVVTPLLNLSHYNMLLEVTPADRRPTYISVFGSLNNALAFVLPMVGVALAEAIGPGVGLVLAGALWIAGGLVFSIWPVRVGDTSRQAA